MGKQYTHKRSWLLAGAGFVAGFALARLASNLVESEDADEPGPRAITLAINERKYPPLRADDQPHVTLEGTPKSPSFAVIGVERTELAELIHGLKGRFTIARSDMAGTWQLAVAEKRQLLGEAIVGDHDYSAVAVAIEPATMQLAIGATAGHHFTPCKTIKIIAKTDQDGVVYDYPDVPLVRMPEA